jgi:hypothetical protein
LPIVSPFLIERLMTEDPALQIGFIDIPVEIDDGSRPQVRKMLRACNDLDI